MKTRQSKVRCYALFFSILLAMLAACHHAAAQDYVEGVSEITDNTTSTELYTYSDTYLSYDVSLYYSPALQSYLYQNSTQIASASTGATDPQDAALDGQAPITLGDTYEIDSYHYVVAVYTIVSGGTTYYNNYYGFVEGGDSPGDDGTDYGPGDGDVDIVVDTIYLGNTAAYVTAAQPSISSISPASGTIGTSGTITVNGEYLLDPWTNSTTPAITGSGVTLSLGSATSDSQVSLNYSISSNATTGNQDLTLATRFGTSNAVTFMVGDPPARITSISPDTWTAGQSISVTITGTGFGTQPSLSINGNGVTSSSITSATNTQIVATVNIAQDAPSGTATVQVQPGYAGSGFTCNCQGQPSTGTNTAQIQPVTPTPKIIFNNNNISGTTQTVVAGQQIALSVATPSGYSIQSQSWSFSNQAAITGGFVNGDGTTGTQPSAAGGGSEAADPPLNQNALTFYWVNPGDNGETVTCTYTLNNGQSASATATFNIGGPTGVTIKPTMKTDGTGVQVLSTSNLSTTGITVTTPQGVTGLVGIDFKANASPPSNYNQAYTFVQLLNGVQQKYITSTGQYTVEATPTIGLDKTYPYSYVYPTETWDTPSAGLPGSYGEGWETFTATMYLMWDPAIPPSGQSSCTPAKTVQNTDGSFTSTASTCASIPIPLSSVSWHWSGCAVNTLVQQANQTTWKLSTVNGCPVDTLGIVQSVGFPEWSPLSN